MYTQILKRAGIVLVVIGAIDIAYMTYCISNKISYSSSFNLFSVIAGVFLIKGSLKTASIVRWFSAFTLSGFAALLVAFPFLQPIDLTLTQIRLNPIQFLISCALMIFASALLYWLANELGRREILEAINAEGHKTTNIKLAICSGVLLVLLLTVFLNILLNGESASRASAIAREEVGTEYKTHVSSLRISKSSGSTSITGVVTAWNKTEIKTIPVSWNE